MQTRNLGWTQALGAWVDAKSALYDFADAHRWWASLAAFAVLLLGLAGIGSALMVDGIKQRHGWVPVPADVVGMAADETAPAGEGLESAAALTEVGDIEPAPSSLPSLAEVEAVEPEPTVETKTVELEKGDTLMGVLVEAGVPRSDAYNAIEAMRDTFDPRKIRPGLTLNVTLQIAPDETEPELKPVVAAAVPVDEAVENEPFAPRLAEIEVQADPERTLFITRESSDGFAVEEVMTELDEEFYRVQGRIDSSLFVAADGLGIPATMIVELIRMYSYDVDFQREVRKNDEFELFYTRYLNDDGEAVKDGTIHFASLTLSGSRHALYRYTTPDDDVTDYYDEQGRSAKKFLMKTPVDGARLSSGFGKRKHPILGYNKMHKGVDFAAPRGTPVMAGGNGVIERAGRNGGYGNYVLIRHANGYKTAYAHLNGFAKGIAAGARVEQGQVIAYVGSTGQSTGPHLHYEILQNGAQVNPMTIRVPTGRVLDGDILQAFVTERTAVDTRMASMPAVTSLTTAEARLD